MFGELIYWGHIIICVLVVSFNLFSSTLVNRIRFINNQAKVAYLFNLPVVITLSACYFLNISTAIDVVFLFLFGECLVFFITFICYKKTLLTLVSLKNKTVTAERGIG